MFASDLSGRNTSPPSQALMVLPPRKQPPTSTLCPDLCGSPQMLDILFGAASPSSVLLHPLEGVTGEPGPLADGWANARPGRRAEQRGGRGGCRHIFPGSLPALVQGPGTGCIPPNLGTSWPSPRPLLSLDPTSLPPAAPSPLHPAPTSAWQAWGEFCSLLGP